MGGDRHDRWRGAGWWLAADGAWYPPELAATSPASEPNGAALPEPPYLPFGLTDRRAHVAEVEPYTNWRATLSLVLAGAAVPCAFLAWFNLVLIGIAVWQARVARRHIAWSGGIERGTGLTTAAQLLALLALGLTIGLGWVVRG